ncbi:MAG TPA: hypothetical protein VF779_19685 [Pyrinomonadaceae bacterium]
MPDETTPRREVGQLQRRRITLSDGRYLIFYTFGEETQATTSQTNTARPQPEPEPRASGGEP